MGMRERQEVLGHRETELRFGNRGQRTEDWTLGDEGTGWGTEDRRRGIEELGDREIGQGTGVGIEDRGTEGYKDAGQV